MAITGTEIRVQRTSWFDGRRAGLVGAALVIMLVAGFLVGRDTAPTSTSSATTVVSTRWIDDTSVRNDVMDAMNGIAAVQAPAVRYLDTASVRQQVMDHMNDLSAPPAAAGFTFGTSVRPAVMEHMNELLGS
jgi:hypothetical protein